MNSQNRIKVDLNPFSGELQLINDLEMGWSVRNVPKAAFFVKGGFTRVYPNLAIPVGMVINVEVGGELIVF